MPVKKIFLQVERFEDKVCMFLVHPVLAKEGVVAYRNVWPGWIQDAQLVHSSRRLDGGQKIGEKFLIALAVEDQHGNAMGIIGRTDNTENILGDDVLEQRGLSRTCGAKHDRLHDARGIGPEPGLSMDVIAEHDCVLRKSGFNRGPVFGFSNKYWRMRPVRLPSLAECGKVPCNRHASHKAQQQI